MHTSKADDEDLLANPVVMVPYPRRNLVQHCRAHPIRLVYACSLDYLLHTRVYPCSRSASCTNRSIPGVTPESSYTQPGKSTALQKPPRLDCCTHPHAKVYASRRHRAPSTGSTHTVWHVILELHIARVTSVRRVATCLCSAGCIN